MRFKVLVSNLGTVHEGDDLTAAKEIYNDYKHDSINVIGRAAGEDVTLCDEHGPMIEYIGVLNKEQA